MKLIRRVKLFYRPDNIRARFWVKKITAWLKTKYPSVVLTDKNPEAVIALGGDGTILEAAGTYRKLHPIILGLNLGTVGFLAAAREPKQFMPTLQSFFKGSYAVADRMMIYAEVVRNKKVVHTMNALNEISVQNPLGMVELEVGIEGYPMQFIRGTGVLVASATGSTAYNLSAHGPIVMPDIKCLIITELLDHNMPTPSIVVKHTKKIYLKVKSFRKHGLLVVRKGNMDAETILAGDGESIFPLMEGDVVHVKESPHFIKFAEIDPHYFFKSLQEKFSFK